MKNENKNVQNILEDMRKITILTGTISKIHEQSLSKWPYIVFDEIGSLEVDYDLGNKDRNGANFVNFYITSSKEEHEDANKRCETLTSWVRDMFWKDIDVNVFINEKNIYSNLCKPSNLLEEYGNGLE